MKNDKDLEKEVQKARKWAELWKKKAKYWRSKYDNHYETGRANSEIWLEKYIKKQNDKDSG
jgi:hypothetical protein